MTFGPSGGGTNEPGAEPDGPESSGWIPPEMRAWRHPSELFSAAPMAALAPAPRRAVTMLVAVAGVAAMAFGLLLLVSAADGGPSSNVTVTLTTAAVTPCCRLAAPVAASAMDAMVALRSARTGKLTGWAVAFEGDMAVTTVQALGGATRVRAMSATGRTMTAGVVATDRVTGITLLRLSSPLTAAPATGTLDLWTGSPAMTLSVRHLGGTPQAVWATGTVVSLTGSSGTPDAMAEIVVRGPSVPSVPGEPLIDPSGDIVGILHSTQGQERVFLPMGLVVGVGEDLELTGQVRHGWLGATATTEQGVVVVAVDPTGASAGLLAPGDTVVSLDGTPVRSAAELHAMLYAMTPGTQVTIQVERDGSLHDVVVDLCPSP